MKLPKPFTIRQFYTIIWVYDYQDIFVMKHVRQEISRKIYNAPFELLVGIANKVLETYKMAISPENLRPDDTFDIHIGINLAADNLWLIKEKLNKILIDKYNIDYETAIQNWEIKT